MKAPHDSMILTAAAIAGATGVVLGAVGAHGLEERLEAADMLRVWETAVAYQMWHALALLALAGLPLVATPKRAAALLWCLGILFFCGSLYALALDGPRWLGPVTPFGGLAFIAGWLMLAVRAFKPAQAHRK